MKDNDKKPAMFALIVQLTLGADRGQPTKEDAEIDEAYEIVLNCIQRGKFYFDHNKAWAISGDALIVYGEDGFHAYYWFKPTEYTIPYESALGKSLNIVFYQERCHQIGRGGDR